MHRSSISPRLFPLILVLLTFLVFFPTLTNDFLLLDDYDQILLHPNVTSPSGIFKHFSSSTYFDSQTGTNYGLFYRPLMLGLYTFIYSLFGPDPLFFHLIQLILHLGVGLCFYSLLSRHLPRSTSFIAALFFLIHPLNSETVLHLANYQDNLFVLFGLFSLLLLTSKLFHLSHRHLFTPLLSLLLFLSLLSKETGILFVIAIPIYAHLLASFRFKSAVFSSLIAATTYLFLRLGIAHISFGFTSIAPISEAAFLNRLFHAPLIASHYLTHFFLPHQLSIAQFWFYSPLPLPNLIFSLLFLALFISFCVLLLLRLRLTSSFKPALFFLLLFFFATLVHLHLFLPLEQTLAERWFYLSSLSLIAFLAFCSIHVSLPRLPSALLLIGILILFSVKTHTRAYDWRNTQTLISADLPKQSFPHNFYLNNLQATLYIHQADYESALPFASLSVKARPLVANLNNLGLIYAHLGYSDLSVKYFSKALTLSPTHSTFQNFAQSQYYLFQDFQKAEPIAQQGLSLYPQSVPLWLILSQTQFQRGASEAARLSAQKAHTLRPDPTTYYVLESINNNLQPDPNQFISFE